MRARATRKTANRAVAQASLRTDESLQTIPTGPTLVAHRGDALPLGAPERMLTHATQKPRVVGHRLLQNPPPVLGASGRPVATREVLEDGRVARSECSRPLKGHHR
jgi:hypothetical protein